MIAQERELYCAPRAMSVDPIRVRAAELAVAHARQHVNLPPFEIVWCQWPGGYQGQTCIHPNGRIEVRLRADLPERGHPMVRARQTIAVVLHEVGHVRDAARLHVMTEDEAERRANEFAGRLISTFPWEELP